MMGLVEDDIGAFLRTGDLLSSTDSTDSFAELDSGASVFCVQPVIAIVKARNNKVSFSMFFIITPSNTYMLHCLMLIERQNCRLQIYIRMKLSVTFIAQAINEAFDLIGIKSELKTSTSSV